MPKPKVEVVTKGEKMGGDEEPDAVDFYASSARKGPRATEVYKSSKVYQDDNDSQEEEDKEVDYAKMTNEQKLELVTSNDG